MLITNEIVDGVFIEENKNRFLCNALIDNEYCECYVPSASKLKNYLNMNGKAIKLLKNEDSRGRTKYSLFSILYYGKHIVLNLNMTNRILEEYLQTIYKAEEVFREKYIGEYKADFLVCGEKVIVIEAKGIICSRKKAIFPTVYCERAIDQLKHILDLIEKGFEIQYYLISLSPIVREVRINDHLRFKQYAELLNKCISRGMTLRGFSVYYENQEIKKGHDMKIIL